MIASVLIPCAWIALLVYSVEQRMSPDGRIYLAMAAGEKQPIPFHLRWLVPKILRGNLTAWRIVSAVSLAVAGICVGMLGGWFAAALFVGLPIVRTNTELPVLVDAPALAATAGAAVLAAHDYTALAVVVACVGAMAKEHVPVFAALAAWNPWLLLALAAPVVRYALFRPADPDHESVKHPWRYARVKQSPRLLDPMRMLLPWGVCLAVLFAPTPAALASMAVAYAMLFVAADSTRVYQWAAIPVCVASAQAVPEAWWLPLAALHLLNPFRGEI